MDIKPEDLDRLPPILLLLSERAIRTAATAEHLPARCTWRRCRASGRCHAHIGLAPVTADWGCPVNDRTVETSAQLMAFTLLSVDDGVTARVRERLSDARARAWRRDHGDAPECTRPGRRHHRRAAAGRAAKEFDAWRREQEDAALAGYGEDGPK